MTGLDARDRMVWPAAALVAAQVVHAVVPVHPDKPESDSLVGLFGGAVLLLLSVAALIGVLRRRPYGRPLGAWTGLTVALGFIAYHSVPWSSAVSNPYLGQPVGAPAWISVGLAVGAGFWAAYAGRDALPWGGRR